MTVTAEPGRVYANTLTDPGTATAAISDLNLATGTLNTNDPRPNLLYDLTGQTLDADTTIFIFANGIGNVTVDEETGDAVGIPDSNNFPTPPNFLTFVDAGGNTLGTVPTDYWFLDPGVNATRAPNLITFDAILTTTTPRSRSIAGATFKLSDIIFTSGGISDIAGFRHQSESADISDFGIAFPADSTLLGDVNLSGDADFFDIQPFIDILLEPGAFQAEADIDGSGEVDFFDIQPFIDILLAP